MTTTLVPRARPQEFDLDSLRREVRAFLTTQAAQEFFVPQVDCWGNGWDPAFSRALAEHGWVGMTIPQRYGGAGRTFVERFVVTEELLAVGAPVSAHWVADRQVGPSLLRYGTEEQRNRHLTPIAKAEEFWAIGMSEPGSGSDLASVRTRATETADGWSITGTKLWTSGAHHADFFFVLARTSPADEKHRHEGLSQFIVPLNSPGVTISPVLNMSGAHHFNEVVLDDVWVSAANLLGELGEGWRQVTGELGFERSGPERFLTAFPLLVEAMHAVGTDRLDSDPRLGALVARHYSLHQMSYAVAQALERHEDVDVAAALVKLLGTRMEGDVVDLIDELVGPTERSGSSRLVELLDEGLLARPGFTIRGGTSQVLAGVVARGLGLR
jgi:alkylation response protein AidB-like acyl-CoA dehydrogenase